MARTTKLVPPAKSDAFVSSAVAMILATETNR